MAPSQIVLFANKTLSNYSLFRFVQNLHSFVQTCAFVAQPKVTGILSKIIVFVIWWLIPICVVFDIFTFVRFSEVFIYEKISLKCP